MYDTPHHSAQKMCHAHNPRLDKFVKMSFSTKLTKNIIDDTAHHTAQKICHNHNSRLDKLDKFVKMSFSAKWTENISWMILHRK